MTSPSEPTVTESGEEAPSPAQSKRSFSAWPAVIPEPGGPAPAEEPEPKERSLVRELPVLLVVAFVIAFLVKTFVAQAFFIPSESMLSTLKVGDRVLVSRISYRLHDPRRGDVVVFTSPFEDDEEERGLPTRIVHGILESVGLRQPSTEDFIKRVIALPGETVEMKAGEIFVDSHALHEPYLNEPPVGDFPAQKVPKGNVWVMGDNRNRSSDSRVFGPIDEDTIVGRAILRIWPIPRLGFL